MILTLKIKYLIIILLISFVCLLILTFFIFQKIGEKKELMNLDAPGILNDFRKMHPELSAEQLDFYVSMAPGKSIAPCLDRPDKNMCIFATALLIKNSDLCRKIPDYLLMLECLYALSPEKAALGIKKCKTEEVPDFKAQCLINVFGIYKEVAACLAFNDIIDVKKTCESVVYYQKAITQTNKDICGKIDYDILKTYCLNNIVVVKKKTFECSTLMDSKAIWNIVFSYEQTWLGDRWDPPDDLITEYNEMGSLTSCRFKCAENFTWMENSCRCREDFHQEGEECLANSRTAKCAPDKPANTVWISASEYRQEWNSENEKWEPMFKTAYSESDSATPCRYQCAQRTAFDPASGQCKSETRTIDCDPLPNLAKWNGSSQYMQVWNTVSSSWQPVFATEYSETAGTCKFKCLERMVWSGARCEVPAF